MGTPSHDSDASQEAPSFPVADLRNPKVLVAVLVVAPVVRCEGEGDDVNNRS